MPWTSAHIENWLKLSTQIVKTADGKTVDVWEFQPQASEEILSVWAKHFRNHYCLDSEIDILRDGTGLDRMQYLERVFPDKLTSLGPSIRSGDFAEILVADYLQYCLKFWVPRTRFNNKAVRDESAKGCDVIGFKFAKLESESLEDILAIYESKAQLTGTHATPRLQDAVEDSAKDILRKADSLNAIKRRLLDKGNTVDAKKVARFQNPEDNPYTEISGAAAVFSSNSYSTAVEAQTNAASHPNYSHLNLLIVHGPDLMTLVHDLYLRAMNEAG
jgi:hypothetical protein